MPKPELYVIYTGERKNIPDTISLQKEFFAGEKNSIDVEVKVLYREMKQILSDSILFFQKYNEQRKLHGATKEAILETIRICKDRNVRKEYLENREREVVD